MGPLIENCEQYENPQYRRFGEQMNCYYAAINLSSVAICDYVRTNESKGACFSAAMLKTSNGSWCDRIPEPQDAGGCGVFAHIHAQKLFKTLKDCDALQKDSSLRGICVDTVAVALQDATLCFMRQDNWSIKWCLIDYGSKTHSSKQCSLITSLGNSKEYIEGAANCVRFSGDFDPAICINDSDPDDCYYRLAMKHKSQAYCDRIHNNLTSEVCSMEILGIQP